VEAQSPGIDAERRQVLCDAAVRAARAVDYQGAGTVEFIADASEGLRADRVWFMEMNTRLQVEHPVTEAVTGLDLVEWQLRVASGEPLPLRQVQIMLSGHAMEARLYAEDPSHGFLPSVGPLTHLRLPDFVRVDAGVEEGGEVTPFYDPMIAKLIAHADTREAAAARLADAARSVEVWPVKTNAAFLARCASHPDFVAGRIDTGFIEARIEALIAPPKPSIPVGAVAKLVRRAARPSEASSPWSPLGAAAGLRLNQAPVASGTIYADGAPVVAAFDLGAPAAGVDLTDGDVVVFSEGVATRLSATRPAETAGAGALLDGAVLTPMPGRIVSVAVAEGDTVTAGQALVVLEAMKMEHALVAPAEGRVKELRVAVGDQVTEGTLAVRLETIG